MAAGSARQQVVGGQAKSWYPQTMAAVHHVSPTFGRDQLGQGAGCEFTQGGALGIPVQPKNAVGVHAAQIGLHQVLGNLGGNQGLAPHGRQNAGAELGQNVDGDARVSVGHARWRPGRWWR